MTVAVLGLGLIGGSLAKVIKGRTEHRVLGFDKSGSVLRMAYESGAIDDVCTDFDGVDIVLVALYPTAAVEFLQSQSKMFKRGTIIVDLCGVKRYVCDSLSGIFPDGVTFIGGHPMAGRECSGYENSIPTLFDGASIILTPDEDIMLSLIESMCDFFRSLGFGHVEVTSPRRHDEIIAYTSQLAHVVSSAYVKNQLARKHFGFSAGSFSDMTRVAKLNEDMWTELFLHNADFLSKQINDVIDNLTEFRDAISARDRDTLTALLRDGREIKEFLDEEFAVCAGEYND